MSAPKKVSFLATGNEIIEGDTQDTNGRYFAQTLHEAGASIFQHVIASDALDELVTALRYLLEHSDAVITCGGLGPTSDDLTRFALAQVMGKDLIFDESTWHNIEARMKQFQLKAVPSNRQQALFPEGADIYPNENGSANACYVAWQGKHIFMLPGPPKECRPIFNAHVISKLDSLSFFDKKQTFRWLTMGVSESEISEQVDAIAKKDGFDTGFRWSYPYLEIKVMALNQTPDMDVIAQVDALLAPNLVSTDRQTAETILEHLLENFDGTLSFINEIGESEGAVLVSHEKILTDSQHDISFIVKADPPVHANFFEPGNTTFTCQGIKKGELIYEHRMRVPRRGPEVAKYAQAYTAWQLGRFLKQL